MFYQIMGVLILVGLFFAILFSLKLGKHIAARQWKSSPELKKIDTHLPEGAIFAITGLIIALTFNSAAEKFDGRRLMIIEEANAISTAYLRVDLLPQIIRADVQQDFKKYIEMRLETYEYATDKQGFLNVITRTQALQKDIWNKSVSGCEGVRGGSGCIVLLPALNTVFDIANTRVSHTQLHPPSLLFMVLILLVLMSSLLAGYRISTTPIATSPHLISFALVLSVIIFMIIDMEYPRVGFIRVDIFDQVLWNVRNAM